MPDPLSDRATVAFVRRVLCGQGTGGVSSSGGPEDLQGVLPPLTSRNDVDLQLYGLLAVVVRDYVQSWYGRMTDDQTFVQEIVQLVAHCSRALEQRLRQVELDALVLDELPELLNRHILAYRMSRTVISRPEESDPREVYHILWPLRPLSPIPRREDARSGDEQEDHEALYRQLLVRGVLAVLLPSEDLQNGLLVALVGQIFSELIVGNLVVTKLSQPCVIWDGISTLAELIGGKRQGTAIERTTQPQASGTGGRVAGLNVSSVPEQAWSMLLQWAFGAVAGLRVLVTALVILSSSGLPSRRKRLAVSPDGPEQKADGGGHKTSTKADEGTAILDFSLWRCLANLLQLPDRMPWLVGAVSLLQLAAVSGPGRLAAYNGILDRLLFDLVRRHLLNPAHLPTLLRSVRGTVFPNNSVAAPSGPRLAPSDGPAARARCAAALSALLPGWLPPIFADATPTTPPQSPSTPAPAPAPSSILDVFDDPYCNKHLVYGVLDLVLVRLLPELAIKGPLELWDERLG